jgi:hypothetical protein
MRLGAVYRILALEDDYFEVCDECGFNGARVDMNEAAARFRGLGGRWRSEFSCSEELLRARPAPETWCALEYAQHTACAIGAIEWAAGEFVEGRSPDWAHAPKDLAGQFEHDRHDCDQFGMDASLRILESAAASMAQYAAELTAEEGNRTADYGGGRVINTAAVVRHALHDAEHHLLDIRRGIARLQLVAAES